MSAPSILIVDDEEDILFMFKKALEMGGFEVTAFSNPEKALDRFKEEPEKFAMVISDIRMPQMDGFEFSKKIKNIKPKVKLMLMTAFELSETETEGALTSLDVDEFLLKPLSTKHLKSLVSKHLSSFGAFVI